jgi:hypothetical protein
VIIFGSVRFLLKKVTKPKFFFFGKKTETEPKPGQTDRFRFDSVFLGKKPVQTGLARFFPVLARFFSVWLGFFGLARVFRFGSVLARFFFRFFVGFGSVRFFQFFIYKTEPNQPVFSKI